ncbi:MULTISPECIES: hypothetical protein [Nocardiopsis]|uniref:hypothetical protein n=1 Tax=Nocardiopsis TaxID=2013 RepID=UPI000369EB56|nr:MULTISPECIES: hypothetical protein [Nocardiopsis]ASU59702.1 hypothetical protein CGQ36_19975 [Nocardiopsis dassonvillei]
MSDHDDPVRALAGRAAALAAFDRGDDGADVAALTGERSPAGEVLRSAEGEAEGAVVTSLRFEHGDLTLDVRVHAHGRLRSLSGLASGEYDHAVLRVRRPGSGEELRIGEDGGFALSGLSRGPVSLALLRAGRPAVVTGWFTV